MKLGCYMPVYGGWFREGVLEEPGCSFDYVKEAAIKAEEIGFDSIWVPDHLLNPLKGESAPSLEAWTTLTALAVLTKNVQIGHITLCQAFRLPAVLAKMSSTLAEISNGRFILGMGAGWYEREFEAYGAPWHDHDSRIARTREQIEIIKSLWTDKNTTYQGSYFKITNGILEPKPTPPPEIWYGGESEQSKSLISEYADCWLLYSTSPVEIPQKLASMKALLEGRKIQYALSAQVILGKTEEEAKNKLKKMSQGQSEVFNNVINAGFVGTPDMIKEQIQTIAKTGIDHLLLRFSQTVLDLDAFTKIL
ncbi:MAG: LLM class flavin-dependent oxidoreductase [Candidatus Heimdallarchaeota archaeon]|nr:MAG: LLM class flavin-dependent oxidoreductase [Candidatus Heimdallarchaeota archaeon]